MSSLYIIKTFLSNHESTKSFLYLFMCPLTLDTLRTVQSTRPFMVNFRFIDVTWHIQTKAVETVISVELLLQ